MEEKAKFDGIFDSLLPVGGLLSGDKVKPVLMNSKLPLDILGRVRQTPQAASFPSRIMGDQGPCANDTPIQAHVSKTRSLRECLLQVSSLAEAQLLNTRERVSSLPQL